MFVTIVELEFELKKIESSHNHAFFFQEELKSESKVGRISGDPCGEYRIAVMVAGLINEMYPNVNNFATHLKDACFPDMEAVPAFVNSIIEVGRVQKSHPSLNL